MSEDKEARLVPVELVEDPCGEEEGSDSTEDLFPKIDKRFFEDTIKAWDRVTIKWFCMHFRVSEEELQRFCRHHYNGPYAEVRSFLRGYTELYVSKMQLKEIKEGNSAMMALFGQSYLGQGRNAAPPAEEMKPITLAYAPKSQREKE